MASGWGGIGELIDEARKKREEEEHAADVRAQVLEMQRQEFERRKEEERRLEQQQETLRYRAALPEPEPRSPFAPSYGTGDNYVAPTPSYSERSYPTTPQRTYTDYGYDDPTNVVSQMRERGVRREVYGDEDYGGTYIPFVDRRPTPATSRWLPDYESSSYESPDQYRGEEVYVPPRRESSRPSLIEQNMVPLGSAQYRDPALIRGSRPSTAPSILSPDTRAGSTDLLTGWNPMTREEADIRRRSDVSVTDQIWDSYPRLGVKDIYRSGVAEMLSREERRQEARTSRGETPYQVTGIKAIDDAQIFPGVSLRTLNAAIQRGGDAMRVGSQMIGALPVGQLDERTVTLGQVFNATAEALPRDTEMAGMLLTGPFDTPVRRQANNWWIALGGDPLASPFRAGLGEDMLAAYESSLTAQQLALIPTEEQRQFHTPDEVRQAQAAELINAYGNPNGRIMDDLLNQDIAVQTLYRKADEYAQQAEAVMNTDPQLYREYLALSSAYGARALAISEMRPADFVDDNTDWMRAMLFEAVVDPSMAAETGLTALRLTPWLRRYVRVSDEMATSLDEAVALAERAAAAPTTSSRTGRVAESPFIKRSPKPGLKGIAQTIYDSAVSSPRRLVDNPIFQRAADYLQTGYSKGVEDAATLFKMSVEIIQPANNPADARLLLQTFSENPQRLMTGIPVTEFQDPLPFIAAGWVTDTGDIRVPYQYLGSKRVLDTQQTARLIGSRWEQVPSLRGDQPYKKTNLLMDLGDLYEQAAMERFDVARAPGRMPGATGVDVQPSTQTPGMFTVNYVNSKGEIIGTAEMNRRQAEQMGKRLRQAERGGLNVAESNALRDIGSFERRIASTYLLDLSPGTWTTNAFGGNINAMLDGTYAAENLDDVARKVFEKTGGEYSSIRLETGIGASGEYQQSLMEKIKQIRSGDTRLAGRAYGEEAVAKMIWGKAYLDAYDRSVTRDGPELLMRALDEAGLGGNDRQRKELANSILEKLRYGTPQEATQYINDLLDGNARVFSISNINPNYAEVWKDPESVRTITRAFQELDGTPEGKEAARRAIRNVYYNELNRLSDPISKGPKAPSRSVYTVLDRDQSIAEAKQEIDWLVKQGALSKEQADAYTQMVATGETDLMEQVVELGRYGNENGGPDSFDPIFDAFWELQDMKARVRVDLSDEAERAALTKPGTAEADAAWARYGRLADEQWRAYYDQAPAVIERARGHINDPASRPPRYRDNHRIESLFELDVQELTKTAGIELRSLRTDPNTRKVIDAGRALEDRAMAEAFHSARANPGANSLDHLVSAELDIQNAGTVYRGNMRAAKAKLDEVMRPPKGQRVSQEEIQKAIDEYFDYRNLNAREFVAYSTGRWRAASEAIGDDAARGIIAQDLKFDLPGYGRVEMIRPSARKGHWDVRLPDGTSMTMPTRTWADQVGIPGPAVPDQLDQLGRRSGQTQEVIRRDQVRKAKAASRKAAQETPRRTRLIRAGQEAHIVPPGSTVTLEQMIINNAKRYISPDIKSLRQLTSPQTDALIEVLERKARAYRNWGDAVYPSPKVPTDKKLIAEADAAAGQGFVRRKGHPVENKAYWNDFNRQLRKKGKMVDWESARYSEGADTFEATIIDVPARPTPPSPATPRTPAQKVAERLPTSPVQATDDPLGWETPTAPTPTPSRVIQTEEGPVSMDELADDVRDRDTLAYREQSNRGGTVPTKALPSDTALPARRAADIPRKGKSGDQTLQGRVDQVRSAYKLNDDQTNKVAAILDARSRTWAKMTGRDQVEYFIESMGPVSRETEMDNALAAVDWGDEYAPATMRVFDTLDQMAKNPGDPERLRVAVHELAHVFHNDMVTAANGGSDYAREMLNVPYNALRMESDEISSTVVRSPVGQDWTIRQAEDFADGFVRYIQTKDSKVPEPLRNLYEQFRTFIGNLMQLFINPESDYFRRTALSPEMRAFYDELLGVTPMPTAGQGSVPRNLRKPGPTVDIKNAWYDDPRGMGSRGGFGITPDAEAYDIYGAYPQSMPTDYNVKQPLDFDVFDVPAGAYGPAAQPMPPLPGDIDYQFRGTAQVGNQQYTVIGYAGRSNGRAQFYVAEEPYVMYADQMDNYQAAPTDYRLPERQPERFTTSQGSTYTINEDGQTVRTKQSPGAGKGQTYDPMNVVYIDPKYRAEVNHYLYDEAGASVNHGYLRDGELYVHTDTGPMELVDGDVPVVVVRDLLDEGRVKRVIPAELTPQETYSPVEIIYSPGEGNLVKQSHLGDPIVDISWGAAQPTPATTAGMQRILDPETGGVDRYIFPQGEGTSGVYAAPDATGGWTVGTYRTERDGSLTRYLDDPYEYDLDEQAAIDLARQATATATPNNLGGVDIDLEAARSGTPVTPTQASYRQPSAKYRPGSGTGLEGTSSQESLGHVTYYNGREYYLGPDGQLYRADPANNLDEYGYRQGSQRVADQSKAQAEAQRISDLSDASGDIVRDVPGSKEASIKAPQVYTRPSDKVAGAVGQQFGAPQVGDTVDTPRHKGATIVRIGKQQDGSDYYVVEINGSQKRSQSVTVTGRPTPAKTLKGDYGKPSTKDLRLKASLIPGRTEDAPPLVDASDFTPADGAVREPAAGRPVTGPDVAPATREGDIVREPIIDISQAQSRADAELAEDIRALSGELDRGDDAVIPGETNIGGMGFEPDQDAGKLVRESSDSNIRHKGKAHDPTINDRLDLQRRTLDSSYEALVREVDKWTAAPGRPTLPANATRNGSKLRQAVGDVHARANHIGSRMGDEMVSMGILDYSKEYHPDVILSMFFPYHFYGTRMLKNALERYMFQPHKMSVLQQLYRNLEKEGYYSDQPNRNYQTMPVGVTVDGTEWRIRFPMWKYAMYLPAYTLGGWGGDEETNNMFQRAFTGAANTGFSLHPWWMAGANYAGDDESKVWLGNVLGGIGSIAGYGLTAANVAGTQFTPSKDWDWLTPEYFPYIVGRELVNMNARGEIDKMDMWFAMDMAFQDYTGEGAMPDQAQYPGAQEAYKLAIGKVARQYTLRSAISWGTGVSTAPISETEQQLIDQQRQYFRLRYSPDNLYGSMAAGQAYMHGDPAMAQALGQMSGGEVGAEFADPKAGLPGRTGLSGIMQEVAPDGTLDRVRPGARGVKENNYAEITALEEKMQLERQRAADQLRAQNPGITAKQLNEGIKLVTDPIQQQINDLYAANQAADSQTQPFVAAPGTTTGYNPLERKQKYYRDVVNDYLFSYPGKPETPGDDAKRSEQRAYGKELAKWESERYQAFIKAVTSGDSEGTGPGIEPLTEEEAQDLWLLRQREWREDQTPDERYLWSIHNGTGRYWGQQEEEAFANAEARGGKKMADLYGQYQDLPDEQRSLGEITDVDMKEAVIAARYPESYDAMEDQFGQGGLHEYLEKDTAYQALPDYPRDGTTEDKTAWYRQRGEFFYKNPQFREQRMFYWGRYQPDRPDDAPATPDLGNDHAQAEQLFGANIWAVLNEYDKAQAGGNRYEWQNGNPSKYALVLAYESWAENEAYQPPAAPAAPLAGEEPSRAVPGMEMMPPIEGPNVTDIKGITPSQARIGVAQMLGSTPQQPAQAAPPAARPGVGQSLGAAQPPAEPAAQPPAQRQPGVRELAPATSLQGLGEQIGMVRGGEMPSIAAAQYANQDPENRRLISQNAEYAARQGSVKDTFGEQGAQLWQMYNSLPDGPVKDQMVQNYPELRLMNMAAYNPNEFNQARDTFGEEALMRWAGRPGGEANSDYWKANPDAWLVNQWMYGRPGGDERSFEPIGVAQVLAQGGWPPPADMYNYGNEYEQAKAMFGDGIWDLVLQYRSLPSGTGERSAFIDAHPEYLQWSDWWYAKMDDSGQGQGYENRGYTQYGYDPQRDRGYSPYDRGRAQEWRDYQNYGRGGGYRNYGRGGYGRSSSSNFRRSGSYRPYQRYGYGYRSFGGGGGGWGGGGFDDSLKSADGAVRLDAFRATPLGEAPAWRPPYDNNDDDWRKFIRGSTLNLLR